MYDWAVSVYSLVITSSIFPIYYSNVAVNKDGGDMINFLGFSIKNSVLYSYSLTFTFLIVAFMNPILSAIADYSGRKKAFMQFFCFVGSFACASLFFFQTETTTLAIGLFILAGIGYSGSFVFYNSYLPEIATEEKFDRISAKGFSMGYIGSVILLIFNLLMIMKPDLFGNISAGLASRLSFLSVGIWWLLFAQYTFYYLPKDQPRKDHQKNWIFNGFKELNKVFKQLNDLPQVKKFLLSFLFYNMGVQTTMYVATVFAEKELHLPSTNLIATVLILQLIAIPGAYLASFLSSKIGNIKTIIIEVVVWIGICIFAYFVNNGNEFYALAAIVGLVMGGIQSISRSTYGKLIPKETSDTASYFSFYEFVYSISIVLGTFFYGFIEAWTGSARNSVLVLGLFFFISLFMLYRLRRNVISK